MSTRRIARTNKWELIAKEEQKLFDVYFTKRVVLKNFDTLPYGF
jgi:hypothetical protein